MADLITVQGTNKEHKVLLWEKHPDHPKGEVFIAGEETAKVAKTPQVQRLLQSGALVEVKAKAPAADPKPPTDPKKA